MLKIILTILKKNSNTNKEQMKDASEEEQEEDLVLPAPSRSRQEKDAEKQSREEQLRRMMDVDGKEVLNKYRLCTCASVEKRAEIENRWR